MSEGCYPGCYYYSDSCFRKDCVKHNNQTQLDQLAGRNRPEPSNPYADWTREELMQEVYYLKRRVASLEKQNLHYSWQTNPDRMGS